MAGRLSGLGFEICKARHFERNYLFDFADLRLAKLGRLLRLRFAGGETLLTFKERQGRSPRYANRREIETRVEDGVLLREVLESLGLEEVFVYQKWRTIYAEAKPADLRGLPQVAYDETPIGNFLELEGPERWIDKVAAQLGYSDQDYIVSNYLALYMEKCMEEGKRPGNMVFKGRKS